MGFQPLSDAPWQRQGVATYDEIGYTASYVCFASDDSDLAIIVDGASATHLVLTIIYVQPTVCTCIRCWVQMIGGPLSVYIQVFSNACLRNTQSEHWHANSIRVITLAT